jgi:hypothetical protein
MAAIDMGLREYDARRVNGYRLYRRRLTELYQWLARMTVESRRCIPGLEPGRADVIVAGAAILLQAMEALGFSELKVSDAGLREGVLLTRMECVLGAPGPHAGAKKEEPPPLPRTAPEVSSGPPGQAASPADPYSPAAAPVPVGGDSGETHPE